MAKRRLKVLEKQRTESAAGGLADVATKPSGRAKRKRKHYTGRPQGADETRRLDEAHAKLAAVRGRIGQFARELMREVYGEHGPEWGTRFRDIEILGDVIGAEVASRFTEGSGGECARGSPRLPLPRGRRGASGRRRAPQLAHVRRPAAGNRGYTSGGHDAEDAGLRRHDGRT
jgi:hypothetical protein